MNIFVLLNFELLKDLEELLLQFRAIPRGDLPMGDHGGFVEVGPFRVQGLMARRCSDAMTAENSGDPKAQSFVGYFDYFFH